jgi:hypothetical protein
MFKKNTPSKIAWWLTALRQMGWLWFGASVYIAAWSLLAVNVVNPPSSGDILFWQDGGLYTLNPETTQTTRITPALFADRRLTEVSPGCHGLIEAPCWVLIGHVIYHLSGRGVPLPIAPTHKWVNAPATWSTDGLHLVYSVADVATGERVLLVYNALFDFAWELDRGVDDAIKPAWSPGCVEHRLETCDLAYGKRHATGLQVVVVNMKTLTRQVWPFVSSRGNILRWSAAGDLYQGRLDWFYLPSGQPVLETNFSQQHLALAPTGQAALALASPYHPENPTTVQLLAAEQTLLYQFQPVNGTVNLWDSGAALMWAADGNKLAVFDQRRVFHYNMQTQAAFFSQQNLSTEGILSYAFAPRQDKLVVVEAVVFNNPERPQQRLTLFEAHRPPQTLRPLSPEPLIILAWLPHNNVIYHLPTPSTTLTQHPPR